MAVSILIPVYNYSPESLVRAVSAQLERSGTGGEIILLDDASGEPFRTACQALQNIPFVKLFSNERNEGRMAARKKLAAFSRFQYLLFLDGDSEIIQDDFLSAYLKWIQKGISLASGGRVYAVSPPVDCAYMLHWKYGSKRESRQVNMKPEKWRGFQSSNFLIRKEIFDRLDFSLQLPGYGHEDTWWGIQFENAGITCQYFNNPVLHSSIEKAEVYIQKSVQALSNLLLLESKVDSKMLCRHVKIYRWYRRLKKAGFSNFYLFFESMFHGIFKKNLLSCKPRLFYFDCYRLAELIKLGKKKKAG